MLAILALLLSCPPTTTAAPPVDPEPLFPVSAEVPEVVAYAAPQYTEAGKRARIQGSVLIDVLIDPEGTIVRCDIAKPLPMGLDKMAFEAAKSWRFNPSEEKRRKTTLEFVFHVDQEFKDRPKFVFEAPFRLVLWVQAPVDERVIY